MGTPCADFFVCHLTGPHDAIVADPIVRSAWMVPVANRRSDGDIFTALDQFIFRCTQWSDNLYAAAAATLMGSGVEAF